MNIARHSRIYIAGIIGPCFLAFGQNRRLWPRHRLAKHLINVRPTAFELTCTALIVVIEHGSRLRVIDEARSRLVNIAYVCEISFPRNAVIDRSQLELAFAAALTPRNRQDASVA